MWMSLAEALLASEDLGKDLQSAKFLLKKHQVRTYVHECHYYIHMHVRTYVHTVIINSFCKCCIHTHLLTVIQRV